MNGVPSDGNGPGDDARRRARSYRVRVIAAVIAAAVVLLIAGGIAWAAIRNGQGRPGRQADDAAYALPDPATGVTAKSVADRMRALGIGHSTTLRYSGRTRGTLIGYEGASAGDRIPANAANGSKTVTLIVSRGPGVPDGIVGTAATDTAAGLQGMGVPIRYVRMPVSDTARHPAGTIVAADPLPGSAANAADGITIGVAVPGGDGTLGADIIGERPDGVRSMLEARGYAVDLRPRFSSADLVGAVVGSVPAPGSALLPGQTVTLYRGVDATGTKDALTETNADTGLRAVRMGASSGIATAAIAGTYCKAVADDAYASAPAAPAACLTLDDQRITYGDGTDGGHYLRLNGREPDQSADRLGWTNFAHDISGALLEPAPGSADGHFAMEHHLLATDWGMAELYAGMDFANCGDTVFSGAVGQYCVDGSFGSGLEAGGGIAVPDGYEGPTGLTYRMKDFLVYFPAGADVRALEASGYFAEDALAEAGKRQDADASRPFVLLRDRGLYRDDETGAAIADYANAVNPFVPTSSFRDGYRNAMIGMKPAPSSETAYYLVENPYDWNALEAYR